MTARKAAIFVDGRYTIQVRQQVDMKIFEPHHLMDDPPTVWIQKTLKRGDRLGFDPWLITAGEAQATCEPPARPLALTRSVARNLIDALWTDQPPRPTGSIATQPTQFAGRTAAEKMKDLAMDLGQDDAVVLTQPDSVAWALNIRGFDVPYTPVVLANAIFRRKGKAELFIDPDRVPEDVRAHLKSVAVVRKPEEIGKSLKALGESGAKVRIVTAAMPDAVRAVLEKSGARIVHGTDPCSLPKARKNKAERQGARAAQLRDGVAMSRFLCWLESAAPVGGLHEFAVAERLEAFRRDTGVLMDLSFDTIAAAGPNAAIPHYHVSPDSSRALGMNEIFLIDSGGQYQDGTTDITRTTIVGTPSTRCGTAITRVLARHDQSVAHPVSQGHDRVTARRAGPRQSLDGGARLRPRHGPWRRRRISPFTRGRPGSTSPTVRRSSPA